MRREWASGLSTPHLPASDAGKASARRQLGSSARPSARQVTLASADFQQISLFGSFDLWAQGGLPSSPHPLTPQESVLQPLDQAWASGREDPARWPSVTKSRSYLKFPLPPCPFVQDLSRPVAVSPGLFPDFPCVMVLPASRAGRGWAEHGPVGFPSPRLGGALGLGRTITGVHCLSHLRPGSTCTRRRLPVSTLRLLLLCPLCVRPVAGAGLAPPVRCPGRSWESCCVGLSSAGHALASVCV